MIDPRIYRVSWVLVFIAVVIFGFSIENGPSPSSTNLSPGANFAGAFASAAALGERFGSPAPGSGQDDAEAAYVAQQLRGVSGFSVSTQAASLRTARGERVVQTVIASRPGLGQGTVVVLANRDALHPSSPGVAASQTTTRIHTATTGATSAQSTTIGGTSATAVLLDLANGLTGATLNRSVMLVSTSASVGAAGADALAHALVGSNLDAVIVLGDLAAARARTPVAVPWSGRARLTPPALLATVNGALSSQAGLNTGYPSFGSELAQLAFPFTQVPRPRSRTSESRPWAFP